MIAPETPIAPVFVNVPENVLVFVVVPLRDAPDILDVTSVVFVPLPLLVAMPPEDAWNDGSAPEPWLVSA